MAILKFTEVQGACREVVRAWQKWREADGPYRNIGGHNTKVISKEFDATIREIINGTADAKYGEDGKLETRDVEPQARSMVMLLDQLGYAFRKWLQDVSLGLSSARPTGSDEFDNALKRIEELLNTRKLQPPEPVAALVARSASPQQIAKKYGWKTEDGSPDVRKVHEEIANPGTHFNEKEWVHPAEVALNREVAMLWATREPRVALFPDMEDVNAPKPVVRSIEELITARAPVEQIARLHKVDADDVLELAKDMGVDLTAPRFVLPVTAGDIANEVIAKQEAGNRAANEVKAKARAKAEAK